MWSPGSRSISTFGEHSGVSSAVCPTPVSGIYSFHGHKKFSTPYRQPLEIDKIRQTKISCMKRGESVSGDQTCPDMQRTDSQPEIFSYAEARMVTIMLNIILCHKSGKTGTKVLAPFSVYKDHKHDFKGCHGDVRRSCSPSSVWGNKCQERLSSAKGPLRAFVFEDELNPTQEMNAIMKHNVRRANPMNAICPWSLER